VFAKSSSSSVLQNMQNQILKILDVENFSKIIPLFVDGILSKLCELVEVKRGSVFSEDF